MGFQNRATEPSPTVNGTAIFQLANACLISGNSSHIATVLLDSGSDRCYITERVRRALNLTPTHTQRLMIYRVMGNEEPKELFSPVVRFNLELRDKSVTTIQANVLPYIVKTVPHQPVDKSQLLEKVGNLNHLAMPLPAHAHLLEVDLLIGIDKYEFIVNGPSRPLYTHDEGIYLRDSRLGVLISGDRKRESACTARLRSIQFS